MPFLLLFSALVFRVSTVLCQGPHTSPKRGLVYVPSAKYPQDDANWDSPTSNLTWYYNYKQTPSPAFSNFTKLEFVPMLWGAPGSGSNYGSFLTDVQAQTKGGANITHVLGFNEPDRTKATGGSDIPAATAAQIWQQEIEPLAKQGVKLGAPACTGAELGTQWLKDFFAACSNCTIDFVPVHWYGNFQGLASHIGEIVGTFNKTVWVTEFADSGADLQDSQTFYNQSSSYMDSLQNVTRYSYFGAFRSDVSNVGANAAMLTQSGKLTDIGSWYLGGGETGNVPKGAASRTSMFTGSVLLVGMATLWRIL